MQQHFYARETLGKIYFPNLNDIRLYGLTTNAQLKVEKTASHDRETSESKERKRESTMLDDVVADGEKFGEGEKVATHAPKKVVESFFFESDGPQRNASVNRQVLSR